MFYWRLLVTSDIYGAYEINNGVRVWRASLFSYRRELGTKCLLPENIFTCAFGGRRVICITFLETIMPWNHIIRTIHTQGRY